MHNQCHQNFPELMKYLVIAAFLAANNPRSTDASVFDGARKQTRKKARKGKEGEIDQKENSGNLKSSIHSSDQLPFSLDRWLSIFRMISRANRNQSQCLTTNVDCILSGIKNMVTNRMVIETSQGSVEFVTYKSQILQPLAEDISQSIGFNLYDYMAVNSGSNAL